MLETIYKNVFLQFSQIKPIEAFVKRQGLSLGVKRFVAGETLEKALPSLYALEAKGKLGILDLLGEFIDSKAGVDAMVAEILYTLEQLSQTPLSRTMSIKPTQLGLSLDFTLALANARKILSKAKAVGAHICLDMENIPYVDGTLRLYKTLLAEGFDVSTVLQSYLYRSMDDLEDLLSLEKLPTLRIVKGAYREAADVAFQNKEEVDKAFRTMVYSGLEAGAKINIATHDEGIIRESAAFIRGANLAKDHYEFQLLYGVKLALQDRLVEQGHPVRIYVPYGEDWYGYFSRRLAERPANLLFVLRGLFA